MVKTRTKSRGVLDPLLLCFSLTRSGLRQPTQFVKVTTTEIPCEQDGYLNAFGDGEGLCFAMRGGKAVLAIYLTLCTSVFQ